jgi:PKD repeat protein
MKTKTSLYQFAVMAAFLMITNSCIKKDSTDTTPQNQDPYAMFQYTIKSNGIVSFTNTSTNATSYLWSFGDSSTSTTTTVNFDHQYPQNGTYKATLTAYGNGKSSGAYANLTITSLDIPEVETNVVTNITQTSATSGGKVIDDGGHAVTARGVCWSLAPNPTITDNKTIDGSGTGSFTSNITGLTANTPYYVRAYATNSAGTGYGNQVVFTTSAAHYIGEHFGGGIVFYLAGEGEFFNGLIAAASDQSSGAKWGCNGILIGGTLTDIGAGQANTLKIVNGCSDAGTAARLCHDLVLNGYNDWFLPSLFELNLLYQQKTVVGGFTTGNYWSSFEYTATDAWDINFNSGYQSEDSKDNTYYVRAIRAF